MDTAIVGGYAVLKYAAQFKCDVVLSFSPQISIDPCDVGRFDSRFIGHFNPVLHRAMRIEERDLCPENLVFYDPYCREDRAHFAEIRNFRGVYPVLAIGGGHMTVDFVVGTETANEFSETAISCHNDKRMLFRRGIRLQRRKRLNYWKTLSSYVSNRGRHRCAFAICGQGLAFAPNSRELRLQKALIAARAGDCELTNTTYAAVLDDPELNVHHLYELRKAFKSIGRHDKAVEIAELTVARFPAHTDAWLALGYEYQAAGDIPFAQAAMLRALEGEHSDPRFWLRLSVALDKVGMAHGAVRAVERAGNTRTR